jgi:hypothetical protein
MVVGAIGIHHDEIATLREKIGSADGKLELILQLLEDKIRNNNDDDDIIHNQLIIIIIRTSRRAGKDAILD